MDHVNDSRGIVNDKVNSTNDSIKDEIRGDSSNSDNRVALEMAIVVRSVEEEKACVSGENRDLIHSDMVSKVLEDEVKVKDLNDEKPSSCVIDVNCGGGEGGVGENLDGEWVCRICHLSSDQSLETTSTPAHNERELIQLGCGCKDELGIAHSYCAEAWFKLKGNRLCEICGETAKNITGVGDNRFMEEWNDRRSSGNGTHSSERSGGCWRGQPFCNFLMACLVIAFVLPWFFRVNMF